MQTYDLLMVLVLVAATLFGFWKGMAWQVASIASLVVSFFVAKKYSAQLAPMISDHPGWNNAVAMLAIYVATSFVIWTLFRLVSGVIDKVKLDGFDHQMGALIGFAKGILLAIVITFFAVTILPQSQKDTIIASRTGEYIVRFLDKTTAVVPPEIHEVIHPYVERIEQRLDPNYQSPPGVGFPTQLPSAQDLGWPAQANTQDNGWPQQQPPQQKQRSIYDQRQPTWPQQPQTQQQPSNQPVIPPWPDQPQTADRPSGAPL